MFNLNCDQFVKIVGKWPSFTSIQVKLPNNSYLKEGPLSKVIEFNW